MRVRVDSNPGCSDVVKDFYEFGDFATPASARLYACSTRPMEQKMAAVRRRYLRLSEVLDGARLVARHSGALRETRRSGRLAPEFTELLRVVVSEVNGCAACVYEHSARALRDGSSDDELEQVLALDLGDFPPEQAVALAFAQHYAETGGHPDPQVESAFRERYGPQRSDDILNHLRHVQFGSTATGTWESFVSRLRGKPVDGSELAAELFVALVAGPRLLLREFQRIFLHRYDRVRSVREAASQSSAD